MSDGKRRSAVCDFGSGQIDPTSYARASMVVVIGPISNYGLCQNQGSARLADPVAPR